MSRSYTVGPHGSGNDCNLTRNGNKGEQDAPNIENYCAGAQDYVKRIGIGGEPGCFLGFLPMCLADS